MDLTEQSTLFLALAAGATLKYAALRWVGSNIRKEYVGKVSRVFVYPLKSGRELPGRLDKVSLKKHGIYTSGVGDRYVFHVITLNSFRNLLFTIFTYKSYMLFQPTKSIEAKLAS